MENKSCKICDSQLGVEHRCKFCDEPTRLFCNTCGVMAEKIVHPACMIVDLNNMALETDMNQN